MNSEPRVSHDLFQTLRLRNFEPDVDDSRSFYRECNHEIRVIKVDIIDTCTCKVYYQNVDSDLDRTFSYTHDEAAVCLDLVVRHFN